MGDGGPKPFVVVVNGLPGTGKTTMARTLADHLRAPLLSKDVFKEIIFDRLGWIDKEWSLRVSATTHRIIDTVLDEELRVGQSVIIESNFKADVDSGRFGQLRSRYGCTLVQVLCWADGEVLWNRYQARRVRDRHPGHVEAATPDEQRSGLRLGRCEPLALDGPTIEVDTTDFNRVDYPSLLEQIRAATGHRDDTVGRRTPP